MIDAEVNILSSAEIGSIPKERQTIRSVGDQELARDLGGTHAPDAQNSFAVKHLDPRDAHKRAF